MSDNFLRDVVDYPLRPIRLDTSVFTSYLTPYPAIVSLESGYRPSRGRLDHGNFRQVVDNDFAKRVRGGNVVEVSICAKHSLAVHLRCLFRERDTNSRNCERCGT